MAAAESAPERCRCGAEWTWRKVWWDSPSANPRWGYLVHCAERHFHWFEAEIPPAELEEARRRLRRSRGVAGDGGSSNRG